MLNPAPPPVNDQAAWRMARSRLIKGTFAGVVQWQNGSFPSSFFDFPWWIVVADSYRIFLKALEIPAQGAA
jgi:hypothetical protein